MIKPLSNAVSSKMKRTRGIEPILNITKLNRNNPFGYFC